MCWFRFVWACPEVSTTFRSWNNKIGYRGHVRVPKKGFLWFSQKVKVLGHMFLHKSNINVLIPVRLSPSGSLYDLHKRRYDFSAFAKRAWPKNGQNWKISFGIQSYFDQSIILSYLRSFQHSYLKCSKRVFWRPWRLHYNWWPTI